MGVNPTSIAELHFSEVITDTALFSSRTSSFFKVAYYSFIRVQEVYTTNVQI